MDRVKPILDQNAFVPDAALPKPLRSLVSHRQRTLGPASMLFYQQPLEIVRGEGVWLFDANGQRYLDAYNNVPILGHCHPAVVSAVSAQLATLNTHTRYLDRQIHQYSDELLDTLDMHNARIAFTCSGSEANDVALRLAQMASGRQGVIVSRAAYHGNTSLVSQVSPSAFRQGDLPDWVVAIDLPLSPMNDADATAYVSKQVAEAIAELEARAYGCAALLVDTIFSSDGICTDPLGLLTPSVAAVKAAGGLFIADEVQPGFGRTGDAFWGFQRQGLRPDIVTMGKPMGNGYPVAAVVASEDLFNAMTSQFGYFNTFGGSSAAIAAAQAVLNTLRREGLQEQAKCNGTLLKHGLTELSGEYPCIGPLRGAGLYFGVDIVTPDANHAADPESATYLVNALKNEGVLIGAAGTHGNTLKIRPPLCFSPSHVERLIETLGRVLKQIPA